MTAVAPPITFQQLSRTSWTPDANAQGGLDPMSAGEVSRMLMPRKGAQRQNSSSSLASTSSSGSSTSTISAQSNGQPQPQQQPQPLAQGESGGWASKRKAPSRGLWPPSKSEPTTGVSRGPENNQQSSILPSQRMLQPYQNGAKGPPPQPHVEGIPVLYLFPINSTFERKQITVPWFPEVMRIGRQTNPKTVPTPANGFFDSKVLSRQHAEIWADRFGKIIIKDVKSSNGTFVNGQRLSQENRDSDPHELRESDILELGIDIVSEDQKTVVHHKVAARVEHAGLISTNSEILNLNFGDIDPTAVGGMNGTNVNQAMSHLRRSGSQGTLAINGRHQAFQGNEISRVGQRNLNFWLTPITMEQIMKRLGNELKEAGVQSQDIGSAKTYFRHVDSDPPQDGSCGDADQLLISNGLQMNGVVSKADSKPRFLDPPAPPPQQPLPEKPDFQRPLADSASHPSLKRNDTAKAPASPLGFSPKYSPSQISSLEDALNSAKQEIETHSNRVKDLEILLKREIEARETAESRALKLEAQSQGFEALNDGTKDPEDTRQQNPSRLSRLFSTTSSKLKSADDSSNSSPSDAQDSSQSNRDFDDDDDSSSEDDKLAAESAARMQQKLDLMVAEMNEMKVVMEKYKRRVENAEDDAKSSKGSLATMVEKVRQEEQARIFEQDLVKSMHSNLPRELKHSSSAIEALRGQAAASSTEILRRAGVQEGKPIGLEEVAALERHVSTALAQVRTDQLAQTAPYATILTVVLVGVGLMTYLNGWQKVDK